uniref:Uncharacterized protein n=1 Tax=Chromera velia CCMP2878 TaxID=1169474 RepID=A0A0G4I8G7_9ALVE|eukprot:Cvel_11857.t1-p1 / transcript=Cvel_11857.t1 / gene=Cvel_11857 / organism=Chromera_velia_CCMP2878 / gene_product=hypothetical protein / transcript_product=hypothetical protein / location=Cvel_scaffold756:33262-35251(-) / protein_length=141 / sequence_SO=supercontig / SO=protein_coding / is_pseudo=false
MPSSAFAKYFLPLSHDQCTAYSSFLPALPLHSSGPPNARACRFQADTETAKEDDAVRCESPRGGAGRRAEGWSEWREEGEEEEDEEEDEEEEAWREEEEEEEEEEEGGDGMGEEAEDDERAAACLPVLCIGLSSLSVWFGV